MQVQDNINTISNEQLRSFLRLCTFGNMQTNASQLTNQEQHHLFCILEKLHKTKDIDIKGLWSIISLTFQNRSGLILMTLFNNSNIRTREIFVKKKFIKDIQILENNDIDGGKLRKILAVLGIEEELFMQKFRQAQDIITHAQKIGLCQNNYKKIITLPSQPVFNDGYDSDPETQHFIKMITIDEQSTFNRRFSVVYQRPFFDQFQFSQENQQEQTITMKRSIYKNPNKPKRKKRAQRPQPKTRKQALMKKAKNVCADHIKLFSVLRQKQRLKKTYKVINLRQQQAITPKKRHPRVQNRHTSANYMQSQSENIHNPQEIDQECHQVQMEQQSYTVQINTRMQRHNNPTQSIQSEEENQSIIQNYMIDQNQIYNQSIENLTIRKIDFPCTIEDLRRNKVINQIEMKQFLYQEWIEYLNVLNQKQLRNQIKCMIRSKNNVQFEDIAKILTILDNYTISKYSKCYLKPLLIYKLIKIIAIMINQIINILYSTETSISTLSSSCKSIIILYELFCKNYSIQKLNNLLFQSMTQIIQFDSSQISRTQSLVQLPQAIQIIKQTSRIKIKQEQSMKQSIMTSIFIFVYVFLSKLSKQLKQPNFQHQLSKLKKQLSTTLLKNIQSKTNILKSICQIYTIYELPISKNEQFQEIVSLFNYINIEQPQKQYFYYLIPNLTRQFIKQKLSKDDTRFNYKPMISYITVSTQIIKKCKNSKKQMPLFLVLLTFSAMMEFYQFHEDMTIRQIIEFITNSIDIQGNYHEEFNIELLKLMIKCYVIKQNQKVKGIVKDKSQAIKNYQSIVKRQLQSKSDIKEKLQVLINKFLTAFIKKHQAILVLSQNLSTLIAHQKLQKYQKILTIFFQDFITNNQIQNSLSHYIFTLTLLFNYIWPLISKPKQCQKQNQFLTDILQLIIKQFYRVDQVWDNFNRLFEYSFQVEEDQANFFFMCQQEKKKYLNSIRCLITLNKDKLSNQFISLSQMKQPRNKLFYEIQGIITTFSIQSQQNSNKTRQLSYHTRQIKIVRSQTQLSCTTNNLIMHFIKGLLKTLHLYSHSSSNNWQFYTKENILDIIFLNLVCGGWDNRQQLWELFNILYKIPDFKNFNHLLIRFKVNQGIFNNGCYLEQYYQSILRKQKNIQRSMCQKFRTIYIQVVKKLWQQYRQHKLYKQQSILALNMLITFKFLLNLQEVSQDTIKAYQQYFIITDTKFTQNSTTLNMLKSIQSKSSALNTFIDVQRFVVEIFWVIQDKNKRKLAETIRNYLEYIVNISLKAKDMDRVQHRFDNIKKFIEAIHNQYRTMEVIDKFSMFLTEQLVGCLLRVTLIKEQIKFSSIRFFLTLFKNYPQLSKAFMKILKQYHQKIDQIIRSMRSPDFQTCQNIQDAILKYILDDYCDFQTLHQIISNRINRIKDIHNLHQLKAITNKSISFLSKQNFNNHELIDKYQQLLLEQENINLQNQRNNLQRIANNKFN